MEIGELQRKMYGLRDPSVAQRLTLAGFAGVWVAVAWWLLFSGGLAAAGGWFGRNWMPGDPVRRACLGAAFSIYYIQILFTEFVFLKRGVSWSEVFSIVMWVLCVCLLLGIAGGTNPNPPGMVLAVGMALFLLGSWIKFPGPNTRGTSGNSGR